MKSYGPADVLRWLSRQTAEELGKSWVNMDGRTGPYMTAPMYVIRPAGSIVPQQPNQFAGPGQYAREIMGATIDLLKLPTLGGEATLDDWAQIFTPAYAIQQRIENSENYVARDGDTTDSTQEYGGIQVVQVLSKTPQERSFPTETPGSNVSMYGIRIIVQIQFTRWEDHR